MNALQRPLAGLALSLSISESEDSQGKGFPSWQVNRTVLQVASALFGQGVAVVFGHDWREDGVMETVQGFAQQMQASGPHADVPEPLMRNVLPWPDRPQLSDLDRERLADTLRIEQAGLPDDLMDYARTKSSDPLYPYLRARALTHLRHRLNRLSDARLCIGGRRAGSQGRFPGIIEEALLAIEDRKPLYLAGALGGASQQIIDALQRKPMPDDFCPPLSQRLIELYEVRAFNEKGPENINDLITERKAVWALFQETGIEGIAKANGLTPAENHELFHTSLIDNVIRWVLTGLARLK